MALFYGRAGSLTALFGGFLPGQDCEATEDAVQAKQALKNVAFRYQACTAPEEVCLWTSAQRWPRTLHPNCDGL